MQCARLALVPGILSLLVVLAESSSAPEEPSSSDEPTQQQTNVVRRRPLRPALSISDRVFPIQLVDSSYGGHVRAPKRKQLRLQTLMSILGEELDPEWMVVEKPAELVEEPDYGVGSALPSGKLAAEALAVNLTRELSDGGVGGEDSTKTARLLTDWLLRKASCPVRFVWDDVGPLFWPRWIKRGECVNDPSRSCSWPSGMHCVPAESVTVHLLRWHCRPRSRRSTRMPAALTVAMGSKMRAAADPGSGGPKRQREVVDHKQFRCQWLRVPYPVTAECFCSC